MRAERGILNNFSPLPLKNEPDDKKILPLNIDPLNTDVTTNPNSSLADAVTLPLDIKVESNASSASAALGISNSPAPLPVKNDPEAATILPPVTNKLPVN